MTQTLTGFTAGIAAVLFVAVYLAVRYWSRQRYPMMKPAVSDTASGTKTQRRSLSADAQHPSMDVD